MGKLAEARDNTLNVVRTVTLWPVGAAAFEAKRCARAFVSTPVGFTIGKSFYNFVGFVVNGIGSGYKSRRNSLARRSFWKVFSQSETGEEVKTGIEVVTQFLIELGMPDDEIVSVKERLLQEIREEQATLICS